MVEVLNSMGTANKPNDNLLEGTLYRKLEGSSLMKFDLSRSESVVEGDTDRSYQYLLHMMKKHAKKRLEDKLIKEKEIAVVNNDRGRSQFPGPDNRTKMYCVFHFEKKNCDEGRDCPYSHFQTVSDPRLGRRTDGAFTKPS